VISLSEFSAQLRPSRKSDAPFLQSLYEHWEILAIWQSAPPSIALGQSQIELFLSDDPGDSGSAYHFIVDAGGSAVGVAQILEIDMFSRSCAVGVAFHPEANTPRGLGTAVHFALLWFCFKVLGLNRCTGYVKDGNRRVIDLCKRIGFREEGTMREARFMAGEFVGLVVLGALASEFGQDWTTTVELGSARA